MAVAARILWVGLTGCLHVPIVGPTGRPITLQRRRYFNQLAGHIDLIDRCGLFGYSLSDWSDRQTESDVAWVGPTGRSLDRTV